MRTPGDVRSELSFLQQGLERRLYPSTIKVYVAAISAHHNTVEGRSVGKHDLVVRFLRGARRLNPPRPPSLPSWDLALVPRALQTAPFEPLQSVELKFLSMKTLLLTALASIKRVGDLQAFSDDESCNTEAPARLCAQDSYHSLQGPGSEPASAVIIADDISHTLHHCLFGNFFAKLSKLHFITNAKMQVFTFPLHACERLMSIFYISC